jgi:hypothetical protein
MRKTGHKPAEQTGDSYSPTAQVKFIDALQYEDESMASVKEILTETSEARRTRRTTLHQRYSREQKKSEMIPSSIDIRLLEANIYLKRPIEMDKETLFRYHSDRQVLLEVIREASFRLTNYTNIFLQKAALLLNIMIDLFVQYQKKIDKLYESFDNLDDSLLPWIDIIKSTPIDTSLFIQEEDDQQINEEVTPEENVTEN